MAVNRPDCPYQLSGGASAYGDSIRVRRMLHMPKPFAKSDHFAHPPLCSCSTRRSGGPAGVPVRVCIGCRRNAIQSHAAPARIVRPDRLNGMETVVEDVACTVCGCVCDDLRLTVL